MAVHYADIRNWKRGFGHVEKIINEISPNGIKLNNCVNLLKKNSFDIFWFSTELFCAVILRQLNCIDKQLPQ